MKDDFENRKARIDALLLDYEQSIREARAFLKTRLILRETAKLGGTNADDS